MRTARSISAWLLVSLLVFLGVSAFAIWQDGARFALANETLPPVPNGIAAASFLDAHRLEWRTVDELHEYAREHRRGLVARIEGNGTP